MAGNGNMLMNTLVNWQMDMINEGLANMRRMARLPFLWQRSRQVTQGSTPSEVVYEEDRLKVLRYKSNTPTRYRTPLIFVFALVNRPYILDLKPGKSVIAHFVNQGFDTYLVDWGIPTDADRHLTLDDYINGYMLNVVENICERTGARQVNLLGYCMGGTMSAMFTSLHQRWVKNLILMAAGIDFSGREGLLQMWTDPTFFNVDAFVDTFGNCPPWFLQNAFLMLKPVQNIFEKPISFWERLDDDRFLDDYFAMEGWLNDNIPVAGEVFREFTKYLYQQNRLVKGTMPVGRHIVDLSDITCPALNLMAQNDDLVPPTQSLPFNDLISSTDKETIDFPAGHIGLAVGSKAQKQLWPQAVDWLASRSDGLEEGVKGKSRRRQ
jgi:polyhydroxyalkanoate synthase subunit PhaC